MYIRKGHFSTCPSFFFPLRSFSSYVGRFSLQARTLTRTLQSVSSRTFTTHKRPLYISGTLPVYDGICWLTMAIVFIDCGKQNRFAGNDKRAVKRAIVDNIR